MSKDTASLQPTQSLRIELEVDIRGDKARVWKALTEEVHLWWPDDFRVVPGSTAVFDVRPGGHLSEIGEDGSFGIWYTVTGMRQGESIHLVGHISPPYGGPTISMLWLRLKENADGTASVRLTDAVLGPVDEGFGRATHQGWTRLIGSLRDFVDSSDSGRLSRE